MCGGEFKPEIKGLVNIPSLDEADTRIVGYKIADNHKFHLHAPINWLSWHDKSRELYENALHAIVANPERALELAQKALDEADKLRH